MLVVGSVALDSTRTPFGKVRDALGGTAVNFATAASYFTNVGLVAVVGSDFPRKHVEFLKRRGVDVSGLYFAEGKTFRYSSSFGYDLNDRTTIDTQLNVFEGFQPEIPEHLKRSEFVFLAPILPELQLSVLDQVESLKFSACDTMDFYIEGYRADLLKTIASVDAMIMNDSECRQLADEPNLVKASRVVLSMGPGIVIVKKGEHGALLFTSESCFSAPAYPCEAVFDPTGAGDAFAGGFMGHLARTGDLSDANIRRAVIYGTVMASFCVEQFSVAGMASLTQNDIDARYRDLKEISHFEL